MLNALQPALQPAHYMMGPDGPWMGFGPGCGILSVLVTVLGIVLVVAVVRHLFFRHRCGHRRGDDALSLLRTRYAKGEIDEEEYRRRKEMLG